MNIDIRVILLCAVLFGAGCSNYETGFDDGFAGTELHSWIFIGKSDYIRGYYDGEADRLHNDWTAVNAVEDDRLICRAPAQLIQSDQFSPVGYQHVAENVFRKLEQ